MEKRKNVVNFQKHVMVFIVKQKKLNVIFKKTTTEKLEEGCRVHIMDKGKCKRTRCCKWKRRCVDGKCSIVHNRCFYRGLKTCESVDCQCKWKKKRKL